MKITLVQSRGVVGDTKVNYFKAKMRISNVESDIFVFPEMYMSDIPISPSMIIQERCF